MRKLSAKWVPKSLNADQKCQRRQSSEQILEFFRRDPNNFLSRLVTMNETRLYHYDPDIKQQSMESGIATHHAPNHPSEKIGFKYSRLDFFGIKASSTSMTFFQRYNL
jgi:hypothetical protein